MHQRHVLLTPEPDGRWSVSVPSLPAVYSFGDTIEEALAMIKEAIELHLECLVEDGESIPEAYPVLLKTVQIDEPEHAETA